MLTRLEKDKLQAKVKALEISIKDLEDAAGDKPNQDDALLKKKKYTKMEAKFPPEDRVNPFLSVKIAPPKTENFNLVELFEAHTMAIGAIAIHPKKSIVATASDDTTWKMWSLPSGKIIMTGDGHKDWVSCCDFHPRGTHLVMCISC